MKRIILTNALLLLSVVMMAQYKNVSVQNGPSHLKIEQIDICSGRTRVFIHYTNPGYPYANIYDITHIKVDGEYKTHPLITSVNMPLNTNGEARQMIFDSPQQTHRFILEFDSIPASKQFNIIEQEGNPNAFNFYGVKIDESNKGDYINPADYIADYPVKELSMIIKDELPILTIMHKGLVVSLRIQGIKQYGKYFMVDMDIKNFTGKSIFFDLDNVKAEGYVVKGENVKTIPLQIFSSREYDKKVAHKQAWNNFWAALGEGMATYNAGYSSSSTTFSGNTYAYGTYGSAYATTYGQAYTQTYDGAAAYAAQQRANENYNNYVAGQYQIRQQINEGYVKANTIANEVEYAGFFNIKYKKIDHIKIDMMINGTLFPFYL